MSPDTHERAVQAPQGSDRIVGEREACKLTSLSRTTLWRLMQQDAFPKKIRLSPNRTGWRLSAIYEWLEAREAA